MANKRWYDKDPVVSLAVNYLEQSDNTVRDYCSDLIIERAKNSGYILVVNNFEYFWQRWQDQSVKHFLAMEYLKIVDEETRDEIAEEVIKYIEELNKVAN